MTLEGIGSTRPKAGGLYIYIPSKVANDSQFPLKPHQKVKIRIDPKNQAVIVTPQG